MNTTCVAKAEVIKPVEGSWEEIGRHMRDITRMWFRLLNTGVTAAHLAHAKGELISTPVYNAVTKALQEDRDWNTKSIDSAAKRKKLQPRQIVARERRSKLEIPSLVYAVAARRAEQAFKTYLKEANMGSRSIPSFRDNDSFCVRCDAWEIQKEGRNYILAVKLHGGAADWTRFVIGPEGGAAFDHFRRLALCEKAEKLTERNKVTLEEKEERKALQERKKKGALTPKEEARLEALRPTFEVPLGPDKIKTGDLQIRWTEKEQKDGGRKGMWMIFATYTREIIPVVKDQSRAMAIHRGMHSLLTYATTDGSVDILIPGNDILEHKRRYQARRLAFKKHRRCRGPGGMGRGGDRTFREYRKLDDSEARFVETACKQWAARAIKVAVDHGCGLILIEDYGTIKNEKPRFIPSWPWAILKSCIAYAAQCEGITVREVPSEYISQTCPFCRHVSADNLSVHVKPLDPRRDMFHCVQCNFHMHVDKVAAFNELFVGGFGDEPLEPLKRSLAKFVREVQDVKSEVQAADNDEAAAE